MKRLILGILVLSASASFAQTDQVSHQLKKKFTAKEKLSVAPIAKNLESNLAPKKIEAQSRSEVKSSLVKGTIHIENGKANIHLMSDRVDRRLIPVNMSQEQLKRLKMIRFRYTVVDENPSNGNMSVRLFDVEEIIQR